LALLGGSRTRALSAAICAVQLVCL
jgi:hypothetical protein